jgi:hypothetical protein
LKWSWPSPASGTAVTLYPVLKRQNEGVALGFVAARVLEAAMIFTGVVSLLWLVTLRQDQGGTAGANTAALVTTGASHVAVNRDIGDDGGGGVVGHKADLGTPAVRDRPG